MAKGKFPDFMKGGKGEKAGVKKDMNPFAKKGENPFVKKRKMAPPFGKKGK